MTYCIGIKTKDGIVVASDSRTNAGLDNVNIYSKMFTYDVGDRTVLMVTSGNLGTSQAVYKSIEKDLEDNLWVCSSCGKHHRISCRQRFDIFFGKNKYEILETPQPSEDPLNLSLIHI